MSDDRNQILGLMNEYCYSVDRGDLKAFAALFEHGSFEIIGDPGGPLHGSQAVLAMLRNVTLYGGKTHTKHVMSNVQIEVDATGAAATAQCYITVFQGLPDFPLQPIFIGHYFDDFERVAGRWRFRRRRISPDLVGDLSRHRADMA
jgi:hypothetical protein